MKKVLYCYVLLIFLALQKIFAAGITLKTTPVSLFRVDNPITIGWNEPIQAKLKFGSSSGNYSKETKTSGTGSLTFVPANEGMPPGVHYCIISAGSLSSPEFKIMIESTTAATMQTPNNNSTIKTTSPVFSWDPVPGVPFYHVILSDQPVVIKNDSYGEPQLVGGNITWQVITSKTSIVYGKADPSGFFDSFNSTPPPLMENCEYNWVVLNNYNNHPAYSSIVQSGVSGFRVDLDVKIAAPQLISPANNAIIDKEQITFSWSKVTGAASYQVLLSETKLQDESETSYIIWRPVTTENFIDFPARLNLRASDYSWRVVAYDNSGLAVSSELRHFSYNVPLGKLHIQTQTVDKKSIPRAEIIITPLDGSTESTRLLTAEAGGLDNEMQPGIYQINAGKEGFADTSATVKIAVGDVVNLTITMRTLVQAITGQVIDQDSKGVSAATVTFEELDKNLHKSILTDAAGGFSEYLQAGNWFIQAVKSGYKKTDIVNVPLKYGEQSKLSQPLKLIRDSGTLNGKVVTSSGIPINGVIVTAVRDNETRNDLTDFSGLFRFELGSGDWQLFAEKPGFSRSAIRKVTVSAGSIVNLNPDMVLQTKAAIITGFVATDSKALQGARVSAIPMTGQAVKTWTGPKGSYILSLLPGDYVLKVALTGYVAENELFVQVAENQTISGLDFTMTAATALIKGYVRRGSIGVAGAVVYSNAIRDTTRADGSYLLPVLPGSHTVQVECKGLLNTTGAKTLVLVKNDVKENINFTMTESAGIVQGLIFSEGNPVAGVNITATKGATKYTTVSGFDGSYWITLPAGIWDISANKIGFMEATFKGVAVNTGQNLTGVDLVFISSLAVLRGTVLDNKNRQVRNAIVELSGTDITAATDRLGNFAVNVNPGTYQAIARKEGYASQQKAVTINQNQTQSLSFVLPVKAVVRGMIRDTKGNQLDKIEVTAIKGKDSLRTLTDYAGEYLLNLDAGSYQFIADQLGFSASGFTFSINSGDTLIRNLSLALNPSEIGKISGKIANRQNQPLSGVTIKIQSKETQVVYSDVDGKYQTDILEVGKSYVLKPNAAKRFFVPAERSYKPLSGDQLNQHFTGGYYGDASSNEVVSSFDGSLVLRICAEQNVAPYYKNMPYDSIAADVSGNHDVSPFDASLIFRYAVGLIDLFPSDNSALFKMANFDSSEREIQLQAAKQTADACIYELVIDRARDVFSGEFTVLYDDEKSEFIKLEKTAITKDAHVEYTIRDGRCKIAMASENPLEGSGALFALYFSFKQEQGGIVKVHSAELNESLIPVKITQNTGAAISSFSLLNNYPNPFNVTTMIRYSLPELQEGEKNYHVALSVYNVLGQRVVTLVDTYQPSGLYQVHWDGKNANGQIVPSGVYLYRLQAGSLVMSKKMVYVR
jgi:hypothetical protein